MDFQVNKPNKPLNSIIFSEENNGCRLYELDGSLYVSGVSSQKEADDLIATHNPPAPSEPTVADKLASVGLDIDELKAALGL